MNQPIAIPRHRKGDTWNGMLLTWTDDNNVPIDISSGYVVKCDFKQTANSQKSMSWSTVDGTITVNSIGQIRFLGRKITVPASKYLADVEITDANNDTQTIVDLVWEIHQDITN